ncbi:MULTISPECIES: PadR family transcriptional regulator [Haloarcula]|uniref:PadR family transcriptional regulator n=3 Tax=Haloarcula TaxID=2237 RepID=A0A830FXG1_HALAR|nr:MULTISPECIES: helix-turn-helix transcriptional regulator [Haloarcula]EMA25193.1 putative transcriptional regulator [Haloarcula argentinensis DSM 12282]MDS0256010.1 PadR family transcriptional regulator [Haloarcula argentinensis]GGK82684.1 PadR family transcriptional regulator [Haloarcula sebkhae]GGM51720.1 PadR family transcriptional regulator [Haloarcula argentinensis]
MTPESGTWLDRMYDVNSFKRDMMVVLAGMDSPMGTELTAELQEYYSEEITVGRVYPQLDDLVAKGLIKKKAKNGRENKYQLTKRGVRELQAHREWEDKYLAPISELSP